MNNDINFNDIHSDAEGNLYIGGIANGAFHQVTSPPWSLPRPDSEFLGETIKSKSRNGFISKFDSNLELKFCKLTDYAVWGITAENNSISNFTRTNKVFEGSPISTDYSVINRLDSKGILNWSKLLFQILPKLNGKMLLPIATRCTWNLWNPSLIT